MEQILFKLSFSIVGILAILIYGIIITFGRRRGSSKFIKDKLSRRRKRKFVVILFVSLLLSFYTSYMSLDLIKKDFIVSELTLVSNSRSNLFGKSYMFDIGNGKYIKLSSSEKDYILNEGQVYIVTYAHRSQVLIRVTQRDGSLVAQG